VRHLRYDSFEKGERRHIASYSGLRSEACLDSTSGARVTHAQTNLAVAACWGHHELPDRLKYDFELRIVFLLQFIASPG
jgi:hypothetical protein